MCGSIVVAVELEDCGESLAGQGDRAELAHLLLAFLLLFQQLLLSGDVAAVALGQNVLAHGLDGLAGDDLAADGSLDRNLEQGAGDVVPQLFADAAALAVGVVAEDDHGQSVHGVAVQQEVQLHEVALAVLLELIVVAGTLSQEMADFLEKLVKAGYNIFVSGGTGAGKTTFLNALSGYIPKDERVITIEDSAELQLNGIANLIRLETRTAGFEGVDSIGIRELIRTALRMRPSRIIVGECRGAEAIDLLSANNTGHSGSLGTGHANGTYDMIHRLETMVLMGMELPVAAIRGQIVSGIDIFIHLGRLRDKSRKVLEIAEIEGMKDGEILLNVLYQFVETKEVNGRIEGRWEKQGELLHREKWQAAGF